MFGLKNGHIRKNLTQKWWTPEIQLVNAKKKKKWLNIHGYIMLIQWLNIYGCLTALNK